MTSNPVGWFEIYVQDMARAKRFYEHVLGVKLEKIIESPQVSMWRFPGSVAGAGASGALVQGGTPSGGNSTLVYFNCDDCSVEASHVGNAGGRVHREKMSIGEYGYVVLCIDTEGNMFGLHSMK